MYGFIESYGLIILMALLLPAILFINSKHRWRIARSTLSLQLILALCLSLFYAIMSLTSISAAISNNPWLNLSGLSLTMLSMISFIGLIVLRYAESNLLGDPDNKRFLTPYLLTLLAVMITVTSNHLVIFLLAWIGISLCLDRLLLFYPDRPRANLAAHKKFIFARFSEILLSIAFVLLYWQHQTFEISAILNHYSNSPGANTTDTIVAILLAAAALIKCAQLPVHGWLIQVVEAPTPVSALLHAGVINLGGFLLLLFSPLITGVAIAQWLILIVAGLSCVLAALVMMTRISIKVRLAWSTVAQMGLMLIECALGLYELAMLHLVAHSCYKAYAFLSSGEAVNHYLHKAYVDIPLPNLTQWFSAASISLGFAAVAIYSMGIPQLLSPWVIVIIGTTTLLAFHFSAPSKRSLAKSFLVACGGILTYLTLSFLTNQIVISMEHQTSVLADIWISSLFICMLIAYLLLSYNSTSASSQRWFIRLNAGFYLDEWSTRFTLWLWPITLPKTQAKYLKPDNSLESNLTVNYKKVSYE